MDKSKNAAKLHGVLWVNAFEMGKVRDEVLSSTLNRGPAEKLDHVAIKGRNVIGFSACNQIAITDDLLVHPICSGIFQVGLQ